MASKDHRVILISKLSETLQSKGLGHDIIEELMEVENQSLRKLEDLKAIKLPTEVRCFALQFLALLSLHASDDQMDCYLKAVQLFDLASQRAIDSDGSLGSVMALAAAAWVVSAKMVSQEGPPFKIDFVAARAEAFAGFPLMTCGDIHQKEMTLLLNFNLSAPTLRTWYDLLSARLDAIFDGALQKSGHLEQLQKAYLSVLTMAVQSLEVSNRNPAHMIALSSFCFALAVIGLVPVAKLIHPSAIASTQMPGIASIEAMVASFSQRCCSALLVASPVPVEAIEAAMQVAVHCSAQTLLLATSTLVAHMCAHPRGHSL